MAPGYVCLVSALCLTTFAPALHSREASLAVDPNGMMLAQNDAAIEQARLFRETHASPSIGFDANGTATESVESSSSDDDSFGAQQILKDQPKVRPFALSAGASVLYTDNVALTRRGTVDDVLTVANAGFAWSPRINKELEATIGANASVFRYAETSELDFENLAVGVGVSWTPPSLRGVSLFAHYDFTELLGRDSDQILMDHALTLGAQKAIVFGRSHSLAFGVTAVAGLSDPYAFQRSQVSAFISYHLQLTRHLETDFLYRAAAYFYSDAGRTDFNQIVSWNLRYRFTDWADVTSSFSYGINRSDHSVFDYNVLTTGASAVFTLRF